MIEEELGHELGAAPFGENHLAMLGRTLLDPDRLRAVIEHPALAEQWRAPLLRHLER